MRVLCCALVLLGLFAGPAFAKKMPPGKITAQVLPAPAYVELAGGAQLLNCDLKVTNASRSAWKLIELEVAVFDGRGALVWRKLVTDGGVSPAIATVPNRELAAGAELLVLNPAPALPADLKIGKVRFALTYEIIGAKDRQVAIAEVVPTPFRLRAALRLPVAGRLLVWSGHDHLSHHRRWDYLFAPIREFGFTSNAGRFAYDLVPVDARGEMRSGDEAKNESWFGFGAPVVAPAAGTVVAVVDRHPDDRNFDVAGLKSDLMLVYGNHVVIDHGNGEHSLFAHLQQGSARVKLGDSVVAGQPVGAIGASGSAMFPHLHYQLQDGPTARAEGLPSYFQQVRRWRGGARPVTAKVTAIEAGDLIESAARPRR